MFDGGWLLPLGQEDALREILSGAGKQGAEAVKTVEKQDGGKDVLDQKLPAEVWVDSDNVLYRGKDGNDAADAFARADIIIEERFEVPRTGASPMELRGAVADWSDHDGLRLWSTTQRPHLLRLALWNWYRRVGPSAAGSSSLASVRWVGERRGTSPHDLEDLVAFRPVAVDRKVVIEARSAFDAQPLHHRETGPVDDGKVLVGKLRANGPRGIQIGQRDPFQYCDAAPDRSPEASGGGAVYPQPCQTPCFHKRIVAQHQRRMVGENLFGALSRS